MTTPTRNHSVLVGRTGGGPGLWLDDAQGITLGELEQRAALLTRVDRKYLLPAHLVDGLFGDLLGDLLDETGHQMQVLEIDGLRSFVYESVYFDSPDLISYRLTAGRRRRRFKVRTRTYVDSALSWIEVKTAGPRGNTIKTRMPYRLKDVNTLEPGRWFVDSALSAQSISGHEELDLTPALANRYRRSTLFLPADDSRVTVDTDLTWHHAGRDLHLPGLAVIETKTGSAASQVDRLLWAHGHRPARISKYATGLAALRPDLRATRWKRTLRRHFTPS